MDQPTPQPNPHLEPQHHRACNAILFSRGCDCGLDALLVERDTLKASLEDADARIEKLDAINKDWASGAKVAALEEDARLCRGMISAQEAMIQAALEPLGCGYPFDHHAAEWAADQIGGLKAENAALSARVQALEAKLEEYESLKAKLRSNLEDESTNFARWWCYHGIKYPASWGVKDLGLYRTIAMKAWLARGMAALLNEVLSIDTPIQEPKP